MIYRAVLLCSLAILWPRSTDGFPNGAPYSACRTMMPFHSARPQTTPAPYVLSYVPPPSGGYDASRSIVVNLNATNDAAFKGYILIAKATSGASAGQPVGTFSIVQRGPSLICDRKGVTQSIAYRHKGITVTWRPPTPAVGPVVFEATVVESYRRFWTNIVSQTLSPANQP